MLTVVVIDDDPIARDFAQATIEGMGHRVVTRTSAMGATAAIMQEKADVVLVDISMPALDGDEWLRMVAEEPLRVGGHELQPAFVIFSGAPEQELKQKVEDTCAVGYISKTAGPDHFETEFRQIVRDLLS